ncbi:unnamed protein product [Polarella glacialis]|uniref:Uncharacterized protein n=1 Tax=Polarella glacialis TaxID=89957 RepID=A0A813ITD4_POLGL|nr:unnamed protein product [Polarella glacialis]
MTGKPSSVAASILARHPSLKRRQLQLLAAWPRLPLRTVAVQQLQELNNSSPEPEDILCTWSYLAGFFDAEDCISVPAGKCTVILSIGQKQKSALVSIRSFLDKEFPEYSSHLRHDGKMWSLTCEQTDFSRRVLRHLMLSGLLVKRKSAEAALSLHSSNHPTVRAKLAVFNGNQSKSKRLDESGCSRARQISAVQASLGYFRSVGRSERVELLQTRIKQMKDCHNILNTEAQLSNLRRTIRSMLGTGCVAT